ncbi:Nramp family divalent metal transporter [Actinomadura barringtoniae]|uniref:Nramp family divalent metal transporter n=1 Tax=Actinomadura barringtoniae TaxID=1427535 RepID=A0A939PJH5_9ACTN|nr:Nramp family divalent metal transporter [Actinomadura barringtoniae]MBO2453795.1 Nramp family divalent metal transporter [Actinomadura barringtoniae]
MNLPISVRSPDPTARPAHPVTPRRGLALAGPAFIAAVAYIDPGNVATNVSAGAKYGYLLLWVVITANVMAMLVQYLSAKLGIATGRNLPELCRERCSRPVRIGLWLEAELIVIMTDLAEIIGGAVALQLLFGLPLPVGGVITGAGLLLILALRVRDRAVFPAVVMGLLAVVALAFAYQAFRLPVAGDGVAGGLVPGFGGSESVLLAAGIVGATVMPHAIYLHSALTQDLPGEGTSSARPGAGAARRRALRATRWDVIVAMSLAGFINITILVAGTALAASDGESLEVAHEAFGVLSGPAIGIAFAVGLLASGLASACVGVYTGQIVMQGFVKRRIPLWVRRVVSMAVPLVLLSAGLDPMLALVLSQVVLSFGIPFALVPLLLLTRDRGVMGDMVNRRLTTALATVVATLIIALNLFMLVTLFREVAAP